MSSCESLILKKPDVDLTRFLIEIDLPFLPGLVTSCILFVGGSSVGRLRFRRWDKSVWCVMGTGTMIGGCVVIPPSVLFSLSLFFSVFIL